MDPNGDTYGGNRGYRITNPPPGRDWRAERRRRKRKTHCPYDHALVLGNLQPSAGRRGARVCLACQRGRAIIASRNKSGKEMTWDEAMAYVARRWPEMAEVAGIEPPA